MVSREVSHASAFAQICIEDRSELPFLNAYNYKININDLHSDLIGLLFVILCECAIKVRASERRFLTYQIRII